MPIEQSLSTHIKGMIQETDTKQILQLLIMVSTMRKQTEALGEMVDGGGDKGQAGRGVVGLRLELESVIHNLSTASRQ